MAQNLGEEVPLEIPTTIKRKRQPKSPTRMTDEEREKLPAKNLNSLRDQMTEPEPLYHAIRMLI